MGRITSINALVEELVEDLLAKQKKSFDVKPIVRELEEEFQNQTKHKNELNIDIYIDNSCAECINIKNYSAALSKADQKFRKVFDLGLSYKFLPRPYVGSGVEWLKKRLSKEEKIVYKNKLDGMTKLLSMHNVNSLGRLFLDYSLFVSLSNEEKPLDYTKKSEIYGITTGGYHIDGKISEEKYTTLGMAIPDPKVFCVGLDYGMSAEKIGHVILHEVSHCFGAKHSKVPFSLMQPVYKKFRNWWDPFSKHAVKKGIDNFLESG